MNTRLPATTRERLIRISIFNWAIIFMGVIWNTAYAVEKNRSFDVRLSPLVVFAGIFDMEANFKINEKLVLGPMLTYWSISDTYYDDGLDFEYKAVGVRAYYHPNGAFKSGLYISPMFRQLSFKMTDRFIVASGEIKVSQLGATVGYLW